MNPAQFIAMLKSVSPAELEKIKTTIWSTEVPDFLERPDDDFCLGRVVCVEKDEGERVKAEFHKTYKSYGWFFPKSFVFHSVQCHSKPRPGQNLCTKCLKKKQKYDKGEYRRFQSLWHGVYGDSTPADSRTRNSTWAEAIMDGRSPPKSV
jgi:hypothetical protein